MTGAPTALLAAVLLVGCGKPDAPATAPAATPAPNGNAVAVASGYSMPVNAIAGGSCSLDAVNGAPAADAAVASGSDVMFGGWMADAGKHVPKDAIFVLAGEQGSYSMPVTAGVDRPDVAAALGSDALKSSGFNLLARLTNVVPGDYKPQIVFGAGAPAFCSLNTVISVTGQGKPK
jgi:hypothetical protein